MMGYVCCIGSVCDVYTGLVWGVCGAYVGYMLDICCVHGGEGVWMGV